MLGGQGAGGGLLASWAWGRRCCLGCFAPPFPYFPSRPQGMEKRARGVGPAWCPLGHLGQPGAQLHPRVCAGGQYPKELSEKSNSRGLLGPDLPSLCPPLPWPARWVGHSPFIVSSSSEASAPPSSPSLLQNAAHVCVQVIEMPQASGHQSLRRQRSPREHRRGPPDTVLQEGIGGGFGGKWA